MHGTYPIALSECRVSDTTLLRKELLFLAEHTPYSGNFSTIAVQCLQKLPSNSSKYTYSCDGHTFNFLIENGFVFLVVADESLGRSVPFVFLERVKDDFKQRYSASIRTDDLHPLADEEDEDDDLFEDRFSIAYNLDREFGPRIKEHMQYCMNHPDEISKLSKLKAQITEVKGIMMDNIEKVLDRGEKIELLVDKTENLQFQLPETGKATSTENVAAESPNEDNGRRSGPCPNCHIVANSLQRFQMLKG
ncbi:vesicle-associated membrane protein 727 [Actinidia rufa]|uniref:Vesicle-associated membrane protein 727 n=1 Tax=Actinidia rufa TaxID=165716 RepID=A0A7J0GKF2_9ERIC|nr:vesicle-associated membrane protein 727 [Actinidia rufa]